MKRYVKFILTAVMFISMVVAIKPTTVQATQVIQEYIDFTLTADNAYQTGICAEGEVPSGDIIIPDTFEYDGQWYKVTKIGSSAFESNKDITSVTIPSTVTKIEAKAFFGCKGLTAIEIPSSVKSIGSCTFDKCTNLASVKMYKMDRIGKCAFRHCSSLKEVQINAKKVEDGAFFKCKKLTKVTFGSNVKTIGNECFEGCGITSINFGKNIEEIGNYALAECDKLETITIGTKVKKLGGMIDYFCDNVKTITIKSTQLVEENCGQRYKYKNTDKYAPPFHNYSKKETIKATKEKLDEYKGFIGEGLFGTEIKYKAI